MISPPRKFSTKPQAIEYRIEKLNDPLLTRVSRAVLDGIDLKQFGYRKIQDIEFMDAELWGKWWIAGVVRIALFMAERVFRWVGKKSEQPLETKKIYVE